MAFAPKLDLSSGEGLQAPKRARHLPGWPQLSEAEKQLNQHISSISNNNLVAGYASGGNNQAGIPPTAMNLGVHEVAGSADAILADTPEGFDATLPQKGNPMALPAASQQYPVLPQAAATAAAAAASALPSLTSGPQHKQPRSSSQAMSNSSSAGGKKQLHSAETQQQRRRAGPVNQWRPGMSLVTQQPLMYALAAPSQQLQQVAAGASSQQRWPTQLSGAGAGAGTLASALQNLLPLPGQLVASQQQAPTIMLYKAPAQLSQQQATQTSVAGGPAGMTASTAAELVPSALLPAATSGAGAGPSAAAAAFGGSMALSQGHNAAAAAHATAADSTGTVGLSPADLTAVGPGWLKLLSCAVEQQGDSLALELLLAGQLYKGRLTRVALPQAADAAAAAAAAAASAAITAGSSEQEALSTADQAALLEFAQQRQGMCFLCALPFAKQQEQPQDDASGADAPALPPAAPCCNQLGGAPAVEAETEAEAAAAPNAAANEPPSQGQESAQGPSAAAEGPAPAEQHQQPLQDGSDASAQPMDPQDMPAVHERGAMVADLGRAVSYDLRDGCCIMLHEACADWSAKSAGDRQQQDSQQPLPSFDQLLACLQQHCCGCDQRAATLHCAAPSCNRMFHVPCVKGMGAALLQDGSCWCSEHQDIMQQHQQAVATTQPLLAPATSRPQPLQLDIAGTLAEGQMLSSPEPSKPAGINPSPSFAAALVLQQMRCSKGYDVLLLGPDHDNTAGASGVSGGPGSSSGAAGGGAERGAARTSAQRRLLEAMPTGGGAGGSGSGSGSILAASPWKYGGASHHHQQQHQPAGLYGSTAEASRQYHLQQQQQGGFSLQGPAAQAPGPATTMLLQRLQQGALQQQQQQQQQQPVGPTRRSPRSTKGRPPLHAPSGKAKAHGANALGLISAYALAAQQQEEARQEQLAASHAAAAAVAVSGPTVVVPRVRAKKGAVAQHTAHY